jgi:hypothetical protein
MTVHKITIFELSSGGRDGEKTPTRYFGPCDMADACVRFSERVMDLDGDPKVGGAWVHLKRLPDSIYPEGQTLVAWTKVSNERPTSEGMLSPEAIF